MTTERSYWGPVVNERGYVLFLPNMGVENDLLQSTPPNPYAESAYRKFPIGTIAQRGHDFFIYCKNGSSALSTLGTPIQAAATVHAEQDDDIVVGATAAIGDTDVYLTSTDNLDGDPNDDANDFADGYLVVNDAAGEGQHYKIKSNEGFTSDEATKKFTLYSPLTVALTTSSEVGLVRNPAYRVVATAAPLTGPFMGVNLLAITASYYFWAQYKGAFPVNAHAAIAVAQMVAVGITAAKADPMAYSSTYGITAATYPIGVAWTPAVADTEKFICWRD